MYESIEFKNFKRFENLKLEDLSNINIILGKNNIGKTTVLEGIFSLSTGLNLSPLFGNLFARRTNGEITGKYDFMEKLQSILQSSKDDNSPVISFELTGALKDKNKYSFKHTIKKTNLFGDFNNSIMGGNNIEINNPNFVPVEKVGDWNIDMLKNNKKTQSKSFSLNFPPNNLNEIIKPFQFCRFVDILTHRNQIENTSLYSLIKRNKLMDEFISEMKSAFPEIVDIDNIPYPDASHAPVSFEHINGGILPMYNFGDGVQRWFNILGGLVVYQNSIHCIEEIDSTFHFSAQQKLAQNLVKYSTKYNNQIFLTTHSNEFLDTFLSTLYGDESNIKMDPDFVKVISLKSDTNNTKKVLSRTLNGLEAYDYRENFNLELR